MSSILAKFRKIVTPKFISQTAFKCKFTQRKTSQIAGIDFVKMLISHVGCGREITYRGLNATLSLLKPKINISIQALSEYFYKPSSVILLRTVYEKILAYQKSKIFADLSGHSEILGKIFKRILVQDSTICILDNRLQTDFPGSGGCASKSSLKIDVLQEIISSTILKTVISPGNKSDRREENVILEDIKSGDLILRDLGYSHLASFSDIDEKGAYFISRLHPNLLVYLEKEDAHPIDIGEFLKQEARYTNCIDRTIYIGQIKMKVRLIAYRVPEDISNERRRKAKRNAKGKGRTASKACLVLCDFILLITNIDSNMLKSEVIGTIYRIRWSIELMFKTWKSSFHLEANLKGFKATRIECILYTILIVATMTTLICNWIKTVFGIIDISLDMLAKWLLDRRGYFLLLYGNVRGLQKEIHQNLRHFKTQKRRRKTTLERVIMEESYAARFS